MLIRWVTKKDRQAWIELSGTVAELFNSSPMNPDQVFHDYMTRKIERFEALAAVDRMSGRVLGIIGFSRSGNRISWFAVQPDSRGKGIGQRLLQTALRHLDNTKNVTVVTFTDEHPEGQAARVVYGKNGFIDSGVFMDENGNKRCIMKRLPSNENRGGSFHYRFTDYDRDSKVENCPCCNHTQGPDYLVDIAELEHSIAVAEKIAQGKLFGKCHVLIRNHY
ncbi:MAG TPA: GNAT family N-acetyltransferase, partial [Proteiniclasticum sp.]|nr:GNAT family N-acetyltransferase [Proteiniclasticum sp.]